MATSPARKRKRGNEREGEESPKKIKGCDRKSCQLSYAAHLPPYCFCNALDKCAKGGHTSRWYHLSAGQHYCNECFEHFYRSHKGGHKIYHEWSTQWEKEASPGFPARASQFMADMWLPVWVQCTHDGCGRWRKLPAHIELHHVNLSIVKCSDCSTPQDPVATMATDIQWIHSLSYTPLLRYCSELSCLLTEYFPEGVGISPTTVSHPHKIDNNINDNDNNDNDGNTAANTVNGDGGGNNQSFDLLHPFNHPKEGPRAGAMTPDILEDDELTAFPQWTKSPSLDVYLIMRNIALCLWFKDCRSLVTVDACMNLLRLRGVVRIWCHTHYHKVLHFLSRRGYINVGMIPHPLSYHFTDFTKSSVMIVGGGPSALSAARHLHNFGYKVTVLEASDRLGGRVHDDMSLGHMVGLGAMFITGIVNNPLTLLSRQLDVPLHMVKDDVCELVTVGGAIADKDIDKRIEGEFNQALDILAKWRGEWEDKDESLEDKLKEIYQQIKINGSSSTDPHDKEQIGLFDFHLNNLEFACGAHLSKISARYWDHNDGYPQYSGPHALLSTGLSQLMTRLLPSQDVHVIYNSHVINIEQIKDNSLIIHTKDGRTHTADKVIVTVPLSILKDKVIKFIPSLSPDKELAINRLGAGLVEKVALKFSRPFWRDKLKNLDIFGRVSTQTSQRGLFSVFYDISNDTSFILITTVSGQALEYYHTLSDEEVKNECLVILKDMFPERPIEEPLSYIASRWSKSPHIRMSYSYVGVGGAAEDYDIMCRQEMCGRLHFAGEATNRRHPQSVTGAYLSGIREACKIIEDDWSNSLGK